MYFFLIIFVAMATIHNMIFIMIYEENRVSVIFHKLYQILSSSLGDCKIFTQETSVYDIVELHYRKFKLSIFAFLWIPSISEMIKKNSENQHHIYIQSAYL